MSTNFFEHQDNARAATTRLIVLFGLAVLAIIAAVYAATVVSLAMFTSDAAARHGFTWWRVDALLIATAVVVPTVSLGSWLKIRELSSGGVSISLSLGARLVDPSSTDTMDRRLLNVVEEMAIASGVPVPAVLVLEHEHGINAFAAGYSARDAAVTVTRGCLDVLTRDQLQGVIAHEFSHILNGDMRLNVRLIGLLHGILVIGLTGLWMLRVGAGSTSRYSRRSDRTALPVIIAGALLAAVGYIGVFFGRLIQAAVSRQREFLADASAVQFTRNPSGLAEALRAIGGFELGASIDAHGATEMSHLFFGDIRTQRAFGWTATHPPLAERIRRLDPSFPGTFPVVRARHKPAPVQTAEVRSPLLAGLAQSAADAMGADPIIDVGAHEVIPMIGTLSPGTAAFGAAMLAAIPDPIRAAVREPVGAVAAIYALVLDAESPTRDRQIAALRGATHPAILDQLALLEGPVRQLPGYVHLPLAELCAPALRMLSTEQHAQVDRELSALVEADDQITLHEYLLQRSIRRWMRARDGAAPHRPAQFVALRPLLGNIGTLLSALAVAGNASEADAEQAFDRGRRIYQGSVAAALKFDRRVALDIDALEIALTRLDGAAPVIKQRVIEAGAAVVLADDTVTLREFELLRVMADGLGCPMPPLTPSDVGRS